jgi:non-ribosomal peptide synthetase component F
MCNQDSNILQFASLSFDASIWEIVMALGSGAQLCLSQTGNDLLPGPNLVQLLRQHAISHVTLPPNSTSGFTNKRWIKFTMSHCGRRKLFTRFGRTMVKK